MKLSSNKKVQIAVNEYFASLEESFFKTGIIALETKWKKSIELGNVYVKKWKHFRKSVFIFMVRTRTFQSTLVQLYNPIYFTQCFYKPQ